MRQAVGTMSSSGGAIGARGGDVAVGHERGGLLVGSSMTIMAVVATFGPCRLHHKLQHSQLWNLWYFVGAIMV